MAHNEATPTISSVDGRQDVLCVLADPACRAVLGLISDRALTAAEVAETTEMPRSTVYRKLDRLIDTPLVEATYRIKPDGKHARQYRRDFDRIRIRMDDGSEGALNISVS